MRTILYNEIRYEMPNAQAFGAFRASIANSSNIEIPQASGFKRVEVSQLIDGLNSKTSGYTFKEWQKGDMHRIYVSGKGVYNTSKVKQNAYIDVNSGKVNVFTSSSQPTKWNVSQSNELEGRLSKYGRYVKRFKK